MDELAITPEELAKIVGEADDAAGSDFSPPLPENGPGELPRLEGAGGADRPAAPGLSAQITPEELAQITSQAVDFGPPINPSFGQPANDGGFSQPGQAGGAGGTGVTARPVQFAQLQAPGAVNSSTNLDLLLGVTLKVTVELGRTRMNIEEILKLGPGSVIELDKLAGEPVDILVNDRLIARGEVVVIEDRFGVRITDVIPPAQRVASFR